MTNIDYIIPEGKRRLFDEQWERILPSQFKIRQDYAAMWYSESPFPYFNHDFLKSLPNEYCKKLKDLYSEIICR